MAEDQRTYYERTADEYDSAHVIPGDEHYVALEYVSGFCAAIRAESLLDVGAGTGRAMAFLRARRPELRLAGVEPSTALIDRAIELGNTTIQPGTGEALPFADDEFDVVVATGVLHHVPEPAQVVAEMARVARKAVFISDSNRFGQGSVPSALAKLGMRATRVWRPYMQVKTRGKGHLYSEGDGVFYSYSVYDSVPQLAEWSPRTFVIPTRGSAPRGWTGGLMTNTHGLLVSIKEPCFPGWSQP